jgi:hypothetical protein
MEFSADSNNLSAGPDPEGGQGAVAPPSTVQQNLNFVFLFDNITPTKLSSVRHLVLGYSVVKIESTV